MSCTNCYDNCQSIVSDKCVKYTGEDIPVLGICNGDNLSELEAAIVEKLTGYADGTGITLSNITIGCSFLTDTLSGKDKTLANLIQMLVDANCSLKTLVTSIQTSITSNVSFDTSCLTVGANPTRDQILQATINKLCSLSSDFINVQNTYVKSADVCSIVNSCIAASQSSVIQEYTKMPKYVALPYHGPLSVFDSNGKGIASVGYDKVYICTGQIINGFTLPDYRGRSPMMANTNVPSTGIDSSVNPALNAGYLLGMNAKKGEYAHTTTITETPSHTHLEPSHTVTIKIPGQRGGDNDDHNNTIAFAFGDKSAAETSFNGTLSVNVTLPASSTSSAGGNQPHNNLHPVVGTVMIMYIP